MRALDPDVMVTLTGLEALQSIAAEAAGRLGTALAELEKAYS